jgi:hypothetical protein
MGAASEEPPPDEEPAPEVAPGGKHVVGSLLMQSAPPPPGVLQMRSILAAVHPYAEPSPGPKLAGQPQAGKDP